MPPRGSSLMKLTLLLLACFFVGIEAPHREYMLVNPDIDRTKLCTPTCSTYRILGLTRWAVPFQLPALTAAQGTRWIITGAGLYTLNGNGNYPPGATPSVANFYWVIRNDATQIPGTNRFLSTQYVSGNPTNFPQNLCSDASYTGEDIIATGSASIQRLNFPIVANNSFVAGTTYWLELNAVSQVDIWGGAVSGGTFSRCRTLNDISDRADAWTATTPVNCSGTPTQWEFPIVIWAKPNGAVSTSTTNEYTLQPPGAPYLNAALPKDRTIAYAGMWFFSQVLLNRADVTDAGNFVVNGFGLVLTEPATVTKTTPVVFRLFRSTASGFSNTSYPYGEPLTTVTFNAWPTPTRAPGSAATDTLNLYRFMGTTADQVNLVSPDIDISTNNAVTALWVAVYVKAQAANLLQLPLALSSGTWGKSYYMGTDCDRVNFAIEPCDARSPISLTTFMTPLTNNMWFETYVNVNSVISTTTASTFAQTSSTSSATLSSTTGSTYSATSSTSTLTSGTSSLTTSDTSITSSSTSSMSSDTSTSTSGTYSTIQGTTSSTTGGTFASTSSSFMTTRLTALSSLIAQGSTIQITTASTSTTSTLSTTGANSDTTIFRLTSTGTTIASTTGTGSGGRSTDGRPAGATPIGLSATQLTSLSINGSKCVAVKIDIPQASQPSLYRFVGFGVVIKQSSDITGGKFTFGLYDDVSDAPTGPLLTFASLNEFFYVLTDQSYPDTTRHEIRTADALDVKPKSYWVALASSLPISISGSQNDAGLYEAGPTDLIPNQGEVFGTVTPSYNLVLYGLVTTVPTGVPTTAPTNGTGVTGKSKGLSTVGLIIIIIVVILVIIAVLVVIIYCLCKRMQEAEEDGYEFEVNDLHSQPALTPTPQPQPENGKKRDSVIDCTT